ncbi:thioredoxin family protein [Flagellimonas sp. S174]|uniref:thioredoxin family protein n=1 Tax=Flagellimonas sp. S174 TaxID=3410790 RepID=UPI0026040666|nr:thioredoxin fold domain-containing protein [uncultured Allomuricauda sp.]
MKKTFFPIGILFSLMTFLSSTEAFAQEDEIQWLSFEQLEDSLAVKPKKVFIDFYADWCAYCKKMDKAAFKDPPVITTLNTEYYAVQMNAESQETISFGGDTYTNKEVGKKRNATHEIPLLLASRENGPFSLPAMVILNEKFEITARYFEYLSPKKLNRILNNQP